VIIFFPIRLDYFSLVNVAIFWKLYCDDWGLILVFVAQVVASQDWPEVTKYAGLVCAQAHRQELIQDLYKTWVDPQKGILTGGLIK
jgi:hypothetical protein